MLVIRRFEEMVVRLFKEKHFFCHYHLYIGQEATGGGTLHMTDRSVGFLSTSAVVGNVVGLGAGASYALKQAGKGNIAVAFFGDGALEEGVVFESMNMAALWSLPVLFLCENNSPGAGAAGEYPSSVIAAKRLTDIPESLGIPAQVVDGADVEAVYSAASEAVGRMRDGGGPFFLEAVTRRWPGSRPLWPDLLTGVTDLTMAWEEKKIIGEHADWIRKHDPVIRYARELLAAARLEQKELLAMDEGINDKMEEARSLAIESPLPQAETALEGAFA
jgi:pyruvate dehydrogenase E1 component alpha subunit